MARRWLRTSCCAVETRRLGDGLHGLSMEFVFGCFIGQIRNTERVMFHAAELFGQNVRFFLTEPRRSPAAAGLPRPEAGSGAPEGLS